MVLWTPNRKTVEAVRVCPRCGGYERSVADRRDFRRYLSIHRICCCGCASQVEVVYSGIGLFGDCNYAGAPGDTTQFQSLTSPNGTRYVDLYSSDASNCYYYEIDAADPIETVRYLWNGESNCSGSPDATTAYSGGSQQEVTISISSGKVKLVRLYAYDSGSTYTAFSYSDPVGIDIGSPISNENPSSTPAGDSICGTGGTATVNYV